MKKIDLWLPEFWIKPLFDGDYSELNEEQTSAFRNFMDGRYTNHGFFTPAAYDADSVEVSPIHDAMQTVKDYPIPCVRITFHVDSLWRNAS